MTGKTTSKIRLSDIAEATSVSVATVSMALQNHPAIKHATRVAIHQAARELGYRKPGVALAPAGMLAGGGPARAAHLGFIAVDKAATQIHEENFAPLVHVLMRQTARMGVRMQMASITVDTPVAEAGAIAAQFADGLDGLLVCGEVRRPLLGVLQRLDVPLVVLGACDVEPEHAEAWTLQRVAFNTVEMARTAVRHQLARGKRQIALMNGSVANQKNFWTELWERGYHMAHAEAGLTVDPGLLIPYRLGEGNVSWVKRLTDNPAKPDSVVWSDMGMAQSAWPLIAASGMKMTPKDHVLSGQKHLVGARGFEGYPAVMEDNAAMARAGILRLKALIAAVGTNAEGDTEKYGGSTVYIPFELAHFSIETGL